MSESLPMPTRGPVEVSETHTILLAKGMAVEPGFLVVLCDTHGVSRTPLAIVGNAKNKEATANSDLIAAAFNAAEACRVMGFDPIAAVQALPKLLAFVADWENDATDGGILDKFSGPEREFVDRASAALAAARTRSQP